MTQEITEAQMVGLVRNALLVAGYEMGQTGDHWPVINATIHSIARDWEESKIQKDVDAEMKIHLYAQLEIMEKGLPKCAADVQAKLAPRLVELRDAFDAYFAPIDTKNMIIDEESTPAYIMRAEEIIASLGGEHV